jgi:uncharacterized membrane protein
MVGLDASLGVYALPLLTAVLWGFTPILDRRGMDGGGSSLQASLVVVVVDSTLYWLALVALRGSLPALPLATLGIFAAAGVVGTALGRLAVFAGVARVGASVSSAGTSARPLFAAALAVVWLGEPITTPTALGIVAVVGGLVALSLSQGGDLGGWSARDLAFPVGAAAFFAVGNVVRRYGLTRTAIDPLAAVAVNDTAALLALAGYALVRGRGDVLRAPGRTHGYFAGSGALTAVALLSFFAAFALPAGRVALVDPLEATAPLFTIVFAAALLGDVERVTRGVVAGAVLVVIGAVLVTL